MNAFRIVFLAGAVSLTAGAGYLSYTGIGRESAEVSQSIRSGSGGNFVNTSVK